MDAKISTTERFIKNEVENYTKTSLNIQSTLGEKTEAVLGDGQVSGVLSFHARWLASSVNFL